MRKNRRSECNQGYNAQAAVDADGTMLVVANRVTNKAADVNELVRDVRAEAPELGCPA